MIQILARDESTPVNAAMGMGLSKINTTPWAEEILGRKNEAAINNPRKTAKKTFGGCLLVERLLKVLSILFPFSFIVILP